MHFSLIDFPAIIIWTQLSWVWPAYFKECLHNRLFIDEIKASQAKWIVVEFSAQFSSNVKLYDTKMSIKFPVINFSIKFALLFLNKLVVIPLIVNQDVLMETY